MNREQIIPTVIRVLVALAPALLLASFLAPANESAAQQPAEKQARLEDVLRRWKAASDGLREAHVRFRWIHEDTTFGTIETLKGDALFKKPDLARLTFVTNKAEIKSVIVVAGKEVRLFDGGKKTWLSITLPDGFGFPARPDAFPDTVIARLIGGSLERLLWIAVGLPVGELRQRFVVEVVRDAGDTIVLSLSARKDQSWTTWSRLEVELDRKTFHVRRLRGWELNGNRLRVEYDLPPGRPAEPVTRELLLRDTGDDN